MQLKVTRWEQDQPPTEKDLRRIYRAEDVTPYSWSNGPGDTYAPHSHGYHKVLMVVRGSITWVLPELNERIQTGPGDRLDLPRGTVHSAEVGELGVTCLEGHLE